MKKPFSLSPRRLGRRAAVLSGVSIATVVVGVSIVAILLLRFFLPGLFDALAGPLWGMGANTAGSLYALQTSFSDTRELVAERDRLASQLSALTETNTILSTKVSDLENLVGSRTGGEKRILAGVLARPPFSLYDTLVVDVGSKTGASLGAYVYGPGGVPLGTIETVTDLTSRIRLFTSAGRETSGWVGDTHVPVTLMGKGGGVFSATLPRGTGVAIGAVVSMSGPGAIPVGHVVRIDSDPSSPRDTLHIQTSTNLFSLTWVELSAHPFL